MSRLSRIPRLATAALVLVLAMVLVPASSAMAMGRRVFGPAGLSSLRTAKVRASAVEEQELTVAGVNRYDTGNDSVIECYYDNTTGHQIEDPFVEVAAVDASGNVDATWTDPFPYYSTNDDILPADARGTFRSDGLGYLPSYLHWEVLGVYGYPSIAAPKRLTVKLTSSDTADGVRYYHGTVTNNLPEPFEMTDLKVSALEAIVPSAGGEPVRYSVAFDDDMLLYYGWTLASGETTTFDMAAYAPPGDGYDAVLLTDTVKAEGALPSELVLKAATTSPVVGTSVKLTGMLYGSPDFYLLTSKVLGVYKQAEDAEYLTFLDWVDYVSNRNIFYVRPSTKSEYSMIFNGDSEYGYTESAVTIFPKFRLTTPVAASTVRHGSGFSIYGYIQPQRDDSRVQLKAYRYERGTWVLRKTYSTRAVPASKYNGIARSKFSARISLPYAGRWRIRAYRAADDSNAANYSGYRYMTAR